MKTELTNIAKFLADTEKALSEFSLGSMDMRGRVCTLNSIIDYLVQVTDDNCQDELKAFLTSLEIKARNCRGSLQRRLLIAI